MPCKSVVCLHRHTRKHNATCCNDPLDSSKAKALQALKSNESCIGAVLAEDHQDFAPLVMCVCVGDVCGCGCQQAPT
jgi:hypothetical protein